VISATVVRAPPGLGKTTVTVNAINTATGPVELYVPTHALAEEVRVLVQQACPSHTVTVIAGRSQPDATGKPLCAKHKLAEDVAKAGSEVYSSLCEKKSRTNVERCQHYATCPYITQFIKPADVTIYTHAHLPLERNRLEPNVPDFAIIDERFFQSCIEVVEVPMGLLHSPSLEPLVASVCRETAYALTRGLPLYDHLANAQISMGDCYAAKGLLRKPAPISPTMSRASQRKALAPLQEAKQLAKILDAVTARRWDEADSRALTYDAGKGIFRVHIKKLITRFQERTFGAPGRAAKILIIDGCANETIIRQWFTVGTFKSMETQRNARVIQCSSTRCSTTSLSPKRNTDPKSKRAARKRLRQLEAFIGRVAAERTNVLVVGPQAITGNPKANMKPLIRVPKNVDLAHFNAVRGIDKWKHYDAVIVIGRNEPPIAALEEIARCIFLRDMNPLQFASDWQMQSCGYRLRTGKRGVPITIHPDARVQAIVEQLREGESMQAVDRLRLVHAPTTKLVIILSNIPLDIHVDELVSWDELMEGSRLDQAWDTLPGVIPLSPEWLAKRFPKLWKTVDAAKADLRRWRKECRFPNRISISNPTLFKHQYRPARSRGGSPRQRAWSVFASADANPESGRAALEGLLGHPVELRLPKPQVVAPLSVTSAMSSASDRVSRSAIARSSVTLTPTLSTLSPA
jgi:hypothetical protein